AGFPLATELHGADRVIQARVGEIRNLLVEPEAPAAVVGVLEDRHRGAPAAPAAAGPVRTVRTVRTPAAAAGAVLILAAVRTADQQAVIVANLVIGTPVQLDRGAADLAAVGAAVGVQPAAVHILAAAAVPIVAARG